ncbi:variable large family protein, partial [Borreliella afzelii]|uniref:variable large family protein n=1 Tax=Borreliella afzelii TaxID=29518 RepID=UPI003AF8BE9B
QAAIGTADDDETAFDKDGMKKDDQIAAAIALRGMAKDGKFAVKEAEKGKAEGAVKSAAESAAELIGKLITAAKEVETAATGAASEAVGTVVKANANAGAGAGVADANSVNGIAKGIKAIVDAAGKGDNEEGKKAGEATNPIQAAIGTDEDEAAAFDKMKKDDQIAAAIALRGMAKNGKFAVKDDKDAKGAVKSAAESVAELIGKLITAAKEVETAAIGTEAVGNVVKTTAADAGAGVADKDSVKGIAKGIKAIVDAVGGDAKLTAGAANGEGNKDAGKLFTGKKVDNKGGDDKDAKGAVKSAAESVAELIGKLIAAAKAVADAATGTEAVGTVVKANAGAGAADKDSVKGIAKGIKAIVDAVGGDAKLTAAGAAKEGNENAGKLFTGK